MSDIFWNKNKHIIWYKIGGGFIHVLTAFSGYAGTKRLDFCLGNKISEWEFYHYRNLCMRYVFACYGLWNF